jgi:predicted DCC family thiol-disulfide oxidoreductase YuxK
MTASPSHNTPNSNLRPVVFYDGNCPLCRREIAHYRRLDREDRLYWVDAAAETEVLTRHGLSVQAAMAELHVLDSAGRWQRGVDAFLVIWQQLPGYRWLGQLVRGLWLRRPLGFFYRHFAAWRYRRRCSADGCVTAQGRRAP